MSWLLYILKKKKKDDDVVVVADAETRTAQVKERSLSLYPNQAATLCRKPDAFSPPVSSAALFLGGSGILLATALVILACGCRNVCFIIQSFIRRLSNSLALSLLSFSDCTSLYLGTLLPLCGLLSSYPSSA